MKVADFEGVWNFQLAHFVGASLGEVPDQGRRGTCLAHALTASHEVARQMPEALSAEYLFWAAKQQDGNSTEDSTTTTAALEGLRDVGQPLESIWPYDEHRTLDATTYQPPTGSYNCFRRNGSKSQPAVEDIIRILHEGGAPVAVLALTPDFMKTSNGKLPADSPLHPVLGFHAVTVVGYGTDNDTGQELVLVRNSWGDGWGNNGYGLVPRTYLQHRLRALCQILDRPEDA
jgi:C1A family cysteine protease